MKLLDRVLTPRGRKPDASSSLALPLTALNAPLESPRGNGASTPRRAASLRKLVSAAGRMLTPRGRRPGEGETAQDVFNSPRTGGSDAQRTQAYQPTLTGLMEQQLRLSGRFTTQPQLSARERTETDGGSDTLSEADSDLSSLDGFGEYARQLGPAPSSTAKGGQEAFSSESSDSLPSTDDLPSPRQLTAPVQLCSPQPSARDSHRAAEDLQLLLQAGELPVNRHRLARLLVYADSLGSEAFTSLSPQLGYERCVALLLQLLLPLPLPARSGALVQLQSLLSSQLMTYLGSGLERVLESERACQRFCRLPFEVSSWLLENGPCDRGETLFDLANLWLEQQRRATNAEQQQALAALVWRRPLAADFLRCMAANLPWAAEFVAASGLRPARPPRSLDGRFSFTAEFDLYDFLELQQSALAQGRPQQQQSPAVYCGGYCWWAVLSASPRHNRFELYASCAPFSLFQEPFRASLQPAADVRFCFLGKTSLAEWRQTNAQRLEAMHIHWGGPAFWAPAGSSAALAGSSSSPTPAGVGRYPASIGPVAAAARPDTARGPRPTRQPSRLSISSSGSIPSAAVAAAVAEAPVSARSQSHSLRRASSGAPVAVSPTGSVGSSGALTPGYISAAESAGALTVRHMESDGLQLQHLTTEQVIAEVRRSCPYAWGASLRVRVHIKLLG